MNLVRVIVMVGAAYAAVTGAVPAHAGTTATLRLSWESCVSQQPAANFTGPGWYKLIISAADFTPGPAADDNYATDIELVVTPLDGGSLADAWRFDDAGCETSRQLVPLLNSFSKACPTMGNAQRGGIFSASYQAASRSFAVRLVNLYDAFAVTAGQRYTLWQVWLDMESATAGPGAPGYSCGGAERPTRIDWDRGILFTARDDRPTFNTAAGDQRFVTWNPEPPVPALPTSWGRVKATYR